MFKLNTRIRNIQPIKNQAYYDMLAKELKEGMLHYNTKTDITTYSKGSETVLIKGKWDNTRLSLEKHNVRDKFNPNPSVPEIVGKDRIIKRVSSDISPFNYKSKPLNILV